MKIEGIIPAMITPFDRHEEIDEQGLRTLVNFLVESGVHGILAAGTVGQFCLLLREERKRLFEIVVDEVNGKIPVFAGTGSVSTKETILMSREAADVGVDAVTVITPYFVKLSDEEVFLHYKAIAEAVPLPITLYNNPPRTGITISPDILERLTNFDNVAGMKDSSGDLSLFQEYIRKSGGKIPLIIGRDTLIYPALTLGAKGAVNAVGNVAPKLLLELYDAAKRGDHERALHFQAKVNILRQVLGLGTFPAAVNEAVSLIGKPGGHPRKPLIPLNKNQRESLKGALEEAEIL